MPYFLNPINAGIQKISSLGDGSTLNIKWYRAFPKDKTNKIGYNIYIDTKMPDFPNEFFYKSPAFVSLDGKLNANISGLTPGQMYRAGIRPFEWDPDVFDFMLLPLGDNGLYTYPETLLREDISATDSVIPVLSTSDFPSSGVVRIGAELIQYSSLDDATNDLVLSNAGLQRGYNGTTATFHNTDGYDGYVSWDNSILFFPIDSEDKNTVVFATQDRFDINQYAFTLEDGYRQTTKDILNQDMSVSDEQNDGFPAYDYAGWHRLDPVAMFKGSCQNTYFGGAQGAFCNDGYSFGVNGQLRGISVQDRNDQRQEILLSLTGEPVVLMSKQTTGIRCSCILATSEQPDARCLRCFGQGFVSSYSQVFFDRRADGRIMARFEPYVDSLPLVESGLTVQDVKPNAWTLVIPTIKARDFLIRFDADGNELYRLECINVTRNILFNDQFGAQKLSLQKVRPSDLIYMVPYFKNLSTMPAMMNTGMASSIGFGPHFHEFRTDESTPGPGWNQITSISQGHSHVIRYNADTGHIEMDSDTSQIGHFHSLPF